MPSVSLPVVQVSRALNGMIELDIIVVSPSPVCATPPYLLTLCLQDVDGDAYMRTVRIQIPRTATAAPRTYRLVRMDRNGRTAYLLENNM